MGGITVVGGIAVVGGGSGVRVRVTVGGAGVRDGTLVGVRLATITRVGARRVLLGSCGVMVTNWRAVSVGWGVSEIVVVGCSGIRVSVGTKAVTTCSVRAAAVPKFEMARSTMFNGSRVMEI